MWEDDDGNTRKEESSSGDEHLTKKISTTESVQVSQQSAIGSKSEEQV